MAVKGLDIFRDYFADYKDSFLLIGGAACDAWFAEQGLSFLTTADLDIVLIIEAIATADLDHPNIVPIYDLGTNEKGVVFYAMKEVRLETVTDPVQMPSTKAVVVVGATGKAAT